MDQKKYHEIKSQIEAARTALQTWNDRKAEAMIELDSIFIEMEAFKNEVNEEKAATQNTIAELRAALEKSDRDFHKHFEAYTNDMQELKLENENLSRRLKAAVAEIENQKIVQKKLDTQYQAKLAETATAAEVRVADQQYQLKTQVTNLVAELQTIQNDKKAATVKADQYEKELRVIRNQMMSFLNVTKEVSNAEVSSPIVVQASALNEKKSGKLQAADIIIDTMSNPPTSVNDYLKRFGY